MKAVFYETFGGPIQIETVPDPSPPPKGVVVKVGASGLCLSDWHGWMGHDPDIVLPHVPGHELAGTIVEIGSEVENWRPGQRVTVPFVGGCGSCEYCNSGDQQVCERQFQPGFTAWGSFAEYVALDYADETWSPFQRLWVLILPQVLDAVLSPPTAVLRIKESSKKANLSLFTVVAG